REVVGRGAFGAQPLQVGDADVDHVLDELALLQRFLQAQRRRRGRRGRRRRGGQQQRRRRGVAGGRHGGLLHGLPLGRLFLLLLLLLLLDQGDAAAGPIPPSGGSGGGGGAAAAPSSPPPPRQTFPGAASPARSLPRSLAIARPAVKPPPCEPGRSLRQRRQRRQRRLLPGRGWGGARRSPGGAPRGVHTAAPRATRGFLRPALAGSLDRGWGLFFARPAAFAPPGSRIHTRAHTRRRPALSIRAAATREERLRRTPRLDGPPAQETRVPETAGLPRGEEGSFKNINPLYSFSYISVLRS
uniref:Uncharacterized protein n=1 Tax=Podarcis muralis TaxID=64176 RepID=A0A670KB48_PODMU